MFPDPELAEGELGVVGVGADFAPSTLLHAYREGIFPWPMSGLPVVPWCSPDPRAVFPLDVVPHWSRSLRRSMRKRPFRVTADRAFADVMAGCADRREGTWITSGLAASFQRLHELGYAHSLEVWNTTTGALVGGIYGLQIGGVFSAESMFHRETDASKVAFASLVERLRGSSCEILDVEVMNPHLASLGCIDVPRREFLARLRRARHAPARF